MRYATHNMVEERLDILLHQSHYGAALAQLEAELGRGEIGNEYLHRLLHALPTEHVWHRQPQCMLTSQLGLADLFITTVSITGLPFSMTMQCVDGRTPSFVSSWLAPRTVK